MAAQKKLMRPFLSNLTQRRMNRRDFLLISTAGAAGIVAVACGPQGAESEVSGEGPRDKERPKKRPQRPKGRLGRNS